MRFPALQPGHGFVMHACRAAYIHVNIVYKNSTDPLWQVFSLKNRQSVMSFDGASYPEIRT